MTSIVARQERDHERLDQLLHQLDGVPGGPEQERVLHSLARLVFPHAFAEESVLWPVFRRVLPDGHELTLQVEQEHQEVNELWTRLEQTLPTSAERRELIDRLTVVLRQDVRDEEDELFPRLEDALSPRQLRAIGIAWEVVRRTAPTRPHAVVSRRPPGNALAALPLTVLDRSRDGIDGVAHRSARLRPHATRLSRGLARAAGRVERVGVLRAGEDASTRRSRRWRRTGGFHPTD